MKLSSQIYLVSATFLLCSLIAGIHISTLQTRQLLQANSQFAIQTAASSFLPSLVSAASNNDEARIKSLVKTIFDQAQFASVMVFNASRLLAKQEKTADSSVIPAWFASLYLPVPVSTEFRLTNREGDLGALTIQADSQATLQKLWQIATQTLMQYVLILVVMSGLLFVSIRRLLRPLHTVQQQASAYGELDFSFRQPLPRAKELRLMVQALNRFSLKYQTQLKNQQQLSEAIRQQAQQDGLTGLHSYTYFRTLYSARLSGEEEAGFGVLFSLSLDDFKSYNDTFGRAQGDLLLSELAQSWAVCFAEIPGAFLARGPGAMLLSFIPALLQTMVMSEAEYHEKTQGSLREKIRKLCQSHADLKQQAYRIGFWHCTREDSCEGHLDELLAKPHSMQQHGSFGWQHHGVEIEVTDALKLFADVAWAEVLPKKIRQDEVELRYQAVISATDNQVIMQEVFSRLRHNDRLVSAGEFMPFVESLGLSADWDRLVLEKVVAGIESRLQSALSCEKYCINLSPQSLLHPLFVTEVLGFLSLKAHCAPYLIFEVSEYAVTIADAQLERFAHALRKLGYGLSIDRFGAFVAEHSYVGQLPLSAIKLDYSSISDVDTRLDQQVLLKSLLAVAHAQDILVMADRVERQSQWDMLIALQVDAGQGLFLAPPQAAVMASHNPAAHLRWAT